MELVSKMSNFQRHKSQADAQPWITKQFSNALTIEGYLKIHYLRSPLFTNFLPVLLFFIFVFATGELTLVYKFYMNCVSFAQYQGLCESFCTL